MGMLINHPQNWVFSLGVPLEMGWCKMTPPKKTVDWWGLLLGLARYLAKKGKIHGYIYTCKYIYIFIYREVLYICIHCHVCLEAKHKYRELRIDSFFAVARLRMNCFGVHFCWGCKLDCMRLCLMRPKFEDNSLKTKGGYLITVWCPNFRGLQKKKVPIPIINFPGARKTLRVGVVSCTKWAPPQF